MAPPPALAQALLPVPALSARVIDQTGTLSAADRQALDARLAAIEQRHGSQMVVLMVPTTRPEDIAAYANRVANQWKIGRRDVGDGVIVLVAQQDRKMRIEVAKTLEGALPDIAAARIIDSAMKPRFQQNDFAGGLTAAVSQIEARIAGEGLPVPGDTTAQRGGNGQHGDGFDWTDLAVFLFFGVMVGGPIARSIFGKGVGGLLVGGGAGGLAWLVTSSLLVAGGVMVLALLYTWLFGGRTGTVWHGGGRGAAVGGMGGWAGSGGWGGGGGGFGSGGGGFSSGGGGDFGGGGASGDW